MPFRPQRAFWIWVAASLVVHAILLSGLPGAIVLPEPAPAVLTAELEPAPPPPPPVVAAAPDKPPPSPKKAVPKPRPAAPAPPPKAPASLPVTMPSMAQLPPAEDEELPSDEPGPLASAQAQPIPLAPPAPVPEPEPSLEPDTPVASSHPPADTSLPQAGTITYDVFYGSEKFSIGHSVQTWSIDKTSYRLTSFSETTGLVGLFRPYQYAYVSEGRVDASGLRPERFAVRRGREGERQAMARFDWDKRELTYGPSSTPRTVPLQAGTYDFLSFIYQLAQTPLTPGRIQLSITTGTKVNRYVLEVGVEEDVDLPLGTVRAIPIRQIRVKDEESVQLWLAADRPQLPVRIRFLDREGRMTVEQLANKIDLDGA